MDVWDVRQSENPAPANRTDSRTSESRPRVAVAMSGGVDSSVAALLLQRSGFDVVGSMLRFWPDDRKAGAFDACCSPQAAYDARRIADRLSVPFYLLDARQAFEEIVVDPFVPTYLAGETPNPCVWCNREIKFGRFVQRARAMGASFMATGHYVRRIEGAHGPELHRGADDDKDQTYFLWALPRDVLPYLLFPLGERSKAEVRAIAADNGFSTAYKKSSSGLCFVADTVPKHLEAHAPERPGPVVDVETGVEVGRHSGVHFFTIGQKRGLGLYRSHVPKFVVDVDADRGIVFVGPREACRWDVVSIDRVNLLCRPEELPSTVSAQVRYRQRPAPASLALEEDGRRARVTFAAPQFAVAKGQSLVFYDGDRLLGGGVIVDRSRSSPTLGGAYEGAPDPKTS